MDQEFCEISCECMWTAIGAIGTIGGFIIALLMLRNNNRLKRTDNLLKLREIFVMHENLLFQGTLGSKDMIMVLSYLGLFEIVFDMYKNKIIDIMTIKNYYEYKIKMVFDNAIFNSILEANKEKWSKDT